MQRIIEFRGNLANHGQLESRDSGKVVMFIVITYIECDKIEPSVVRIRFLALHKSVMLRDKVSSDWVNPHTKQSGSKVKQQGLDAKKVGKGSIKCNGGDIVSEFLHVHGLWVNEKGTQGVESGLKNDPDHLLPGGVENFAFQIRRHIDVNNVDSL